MIERRPFGTHRPPEHRDPVRGAPRWPAPARRRPTARWRSCSARRQPHRHRGAIRRLRAAHRALDGPPPAGLLPGDQDRAARPRARPARTSTARSSGSGSTHVDLIQLHSLGHPDDWDQAMGPGGALEAVVEARAQGLTRFIGVTGHGWTIAAMHRRSLARFDFDSILLPYNFFMAGDERYRHAFEEVLATCPRAPGGGAGHQVASRAGPGPPPSGRTRPGISPSRRRRDIDRGGALGARPAARRLPQHRG